MPYQARSFPNSVSGLEVDRRFPSYDVLADPLNRHLAVLGLEQFQSCSAELALVNTRRPPRNRASVGEGRTQLLLNKR